MAAHPVAGHRRHVSLRSLPAPDTVTKAILALKRHTPEDPPRVMSPLYPGRTEMARDVRDSRLHARLERVFLRWAWFAGFRPWEMARAHGNGDNTPPHWVAGS